MTESLGMLIDLRRCIGCNACQVACKMENGVPIGGFRTRVEIADTGSFPEPKRHFLPKMCNQCDITPCVSACPVPGATYKGQDGIVAINRDLCIGCGKCVDACPYGARYMQPNIPVKNDPKPFAKDVPEVRGKTAAQLTVADKCDWCADSRAQGLDDPACVRSCFGKAMVFGDMNDPNSRIAQLMKENQTSVRHPEYGTKPRVHYIAPDPEVFKTADGLLNPRRS